VTSAQAKALRLAGVTRVSLGVQDFDPEVQKAIGREQPYDLVEKAVGLLRENGVTSVNFDLMYGLPLQSSVGMLRTARLVAALRPDRVSLFSYAHMPRLKKHQQSLEAYGLPSPRVALSLERSARKALVEEGYAEIGMDHFALPEDSLAKAAETGALHRSFQGYTDDDSSLLLGLGASAIGRSSRHYFQNIKDTVSYRRAVSEKGLAVAKGLRLSREDVFRGAIIETLMCFMSVNLESLCRQHDFSLSSLSAEMEALVPYEKAGVVRREGWTLSLAIPQRMAIRAVAAVFDTTLASATTYASKTV
jgi:oxygen-independent coproporphyrinogen-3 oxidase